MNRRVFLTGVTTGVLSGWRFNLDAEATVISPWAPHSTDLEAQIPDLMRTTNVPGLSLAVFRSGRIVWLRAFGVKDRASGVPVDTGTLFEAASMSKPLFAYVVLKLCEKGTVSLDTPLTHYTHTRLLDDPRLGQITARHILSHSSGIVPDWRSADEPLKIAFSPGEKWSYSGEGYWYLQSVVTELTGHTDFTQCDKFETGLKVCATDFGEFMESRLVLPFGLKSSGYVHKEWFDNRKARPHDVKGNPLPYRPGRAIDIARYGAAGGLLTTPGDYAKFMMEVIDPKPQDDHHLSASSVKQMMTAQVEVARLGDDVVSWGLGWRIARTPHAVFFGHGGENPGFQCISEASASDRSGYVAMANGENGSKLLEKLAPEISARLHS